MSLKTRIRGFTAWVNLRVMPYDQLLNNVIMDLLTGTSMKYLIESITGRDFVKLESFDGGPVTLNWLNVIVQLLNNVIMDLLTGTSMKYLIESITGRDFVKLESFDGLSQQQKQTRVEWMLQELKRCNVIPLDIKVDCRMFAMRSSDHVFDLLWRLVSHDIWFVWERAEYLQHEDRDILTQVKFKWTPEPPPKKKKKAKPKKSLLSGFGASAEVDEDPIDAEPEAEWVKFPNSDFMKNFKRKRTAGKYPSPDQCILQLVNAQLKKTKEGRGLICYSINDLVDSRVLCTLVNSFVPNTFTTDLLLNDRWTINIALRTAEKMFYNETPFDSEDLAEADAMAVSAYFTSFFMVAYKYRQCKAVAERVNWISQLIRECNHELEKYPPVVSNLTELQRRKEIKSNIEGHKEAIEKMEKRFDVKYCKKWVDHVNIVQSEIRKEIRNKIKSRFDILTIPRSITTNDLCLSYVINLSLTTGSGFYKAENKEMLTEGRRLVLRHVQTGEFIDDFTCKSKVSVRQVLKLPADNVVEINPLDFPDYELYFEAQSRNKHFKTGMRFLYQVFPGSTITWNRMFIRAAKENESDTLEKLLTFFRGHPRFINSREPKTGHTALHWACRFGHYDVVALLLEFGANIDAKNHFRCTPLYTAIEGLHRKVCHLLIEWGCDMHCKNVKMQTPIESCKNDEFRKYLADLYEHYSNIIPQIMNGDMQLMDEVIKQHRSGEHEFCSLSSRCVNGSTLLHTAAYYGHKPAIQELLDQRVSIDLKDYKGATPLHRAKDHDTVQMLLESGAPINAVDSEGNTPLHVKCYGEMDKPSELTSVEFLLTEGADPNRRNNRNLLPIHCCAMQGRVDLMMMLIKADSEEKILKALNSEEGRNPPSLVHLAIANDFLHCADWLLKNGFTFKSKEIDILLKRILTDQIKLSNRADAVKFLLDCGADSNPCYPGGNSALHYAASIPGSTDILETLLAYGAEADATNEEGCTPLFFATQANNQFAACVLIAQGTNVRQKNYQGLTAFDNIVDFEEWIESGYFTDEIKARLKAYSLKHARDLIRAISKRVKQNPTQIRSDLIYPSQMIQPSITNSPYAMMQTRTISQGPSNMLLPPIGKETSFYSF